MFPEDRGREETVERSSSNMRTLQYIVEITTDGGEQNFILPSRF